MTLLIGRKIALGFLLALGVLVAVGLTAYRNFVETSADAQWVTHTVEVLLNIESINADLKDSEANARGFLINGESQFADDFRQNGEELDRRIAQLSALTADNVMQQERLLTLRTLVASRRENSRQLIELRRRGSTLSDGATVDLVREGRSLSAKVRQSLSDMTSEEQRLLRERQERADDNRRLAMHLIEYGTLAALALVGLVGLGVTRSITRPLKLLQTGAIAIGEGNYTHRVAIESSDEVGQLAGVFNRMAEQIRDRQQQMDEQNWLKTRVAEFARLFQGQRDLHTMGTAVLHELAKQLDLRQGTFYFRRHQEDALSLIAGYATEKPTQKLAAGEGLVGQCLLENRRLVLDAIPPGYFVSSTLGRTTPKFILVQPVTFEGAVKGVIEISSCHAPTELQLTLLDRLSESLGIVLTSIESAQRTEELLVQARSLTATLRRNELELQEKNAELEMQTEQLRKSEGLLQEQQEELRQSNEELQQTNEELRQTTEEMEEKANLLFEQKGQLEQINRQIEQARERLERQAEQLELTSKYKSDFLANMSHELRTPLNSLLILSKMLADNPDQTLTAKQVQYAKTIQSSGHDLLDLINDILDLSKIEAGKVDLEIEEVELADVVHFAESTFRPIAENKKLAFSTSLDPALPKTISTDRRRLEQIVKNLLSNAIKFTEKGTVDFNISSVIGGPAAEPLDHLTGDLSIAFAVRDSGIGVAPDKQRLIFEAFRQADAGTARRFGGTGLGLSISRELARLLKGSIELESEPGQGSKFTLLLPPVWQKGAAAPSVSAESPHTRSPLPRRPLSNSRIVTDDTVMPFPSNDVDDDRANLKAGDLVLLIIEDDKNFAQILVDFAREKHFKAVVAATAAQGMALAQAVKPAAITLDLRLPDQDGWVVIDWLKHQPQMRHIPIHVISVEEERERSLRLGAVSHLLKPVTRETLTHALNDTVAFLERPVKELLVIEDDAAGRQAIVDLIGNGDVHTTAVGSGQEALTELEKRRFDCLVLDLGLPDISGTALLKEIQQRYKDRSPPVIIYTGKDLTRAEETELRMNAESIILKSVRSPERLLDETALFLHRVQAKLPDAKRRLIERGQKNDPVLVGRNVLVVDDDVRNIFAITSALESYQMNVLYAESGQGALNLLQQHPEVEIVLMDVMMPEMDGYEAIRQIRQTDRFKKTPVISITAKAMKGDRDKCLDAGASDYLAKPVDMDKLLSLLRVWLYR